MPKQRRMMTKLNFFYPHFLQPSGRIWVAKPENIFKQRGKLWRVITVSISPIPGSVPVVELEEVPQAETEVANAARRDIK